MTAISGFGQKKRSGVVGIESAIVLIAFVIVAAALAFVVLNMGFSTTQKAKTTINSGMSEASSAIELASSVVGQGNVTAQKLSAYTIPIKLAGGGSSVDLTHTKTTVKYFSKTVSYDNIYKGTMSNATFSSLDDALSQAVDEGKISQLPSVGSGPNNTSAILYFTQNVNYNDILDSGEHAMMMIVFKSSERPAALDVLNVEIIVSSGSVLTISRSVPTISGSIISLG